MLSVGIPAGPDVPDAATLEAVASEVAPAPLVLQAPKEAEMAIGSQDVNGASSPLLASIPADAYGGAAPTTSGIDDVYVLEDAPNEIIDLHAAFEDAETPDEAMVYAVVENTNPSLFDSVHIDGYGGGGYGGLVLDFAADAYGSAELTVRATDADGMWVETSFMVHVEPVNDAPVISNFAGTEGPGDFWTFSGVVTDVDHNVAGMIVTFGGVLADYHVTATVQANGTFSLTDEFPGLQSGAATAQTTDPGGLQSNVAWDWVSPT